MYYNSNSWNGMNNGGPRPQPGYPSPVERFHYQDPSYSQQQQQVMAKCQTPRRMGEPGIPRPHLSQTGQPDPARNPWDGKMTHAAYNSVQYGVSGAHMNQYAQNRMPYRSPTSSVMDQPAMRMPGSSVDNGRYGQMQHSLQYSPAYRNSAIHAAAKMGQPSQGSYEASRDTMTSMYAGQSYGARQPHPFSVSRMTSPPGPSYLRPRQPASSPQILSHSTVPVSSAMTSPNYRIGGMHQGPQSSTFAGDVAYPDTTPAPFKHPTGYVNPSHAAKFQNTGVMDYRPPFDKPAGTPLRPTLPQQRVSSGDMYSRNFAYGASAAEKPVCAMRTSTLPVPQIEVPAPITSKQNNSFSADVSVPEIPGEFNLESLLDGPLESGGSFMQQLEDVAPESFTSPTKDTAKSSSDEKSPLRPPLGATAFASPSRSDIVTNQTPPQASVQPLATANVPTAPVAGAAIGPTVTQPQVNMPYRSSAIGVPAPVPPITARFPAQSVRPSFVPSVQQVQLQRPMYQTSEHPVQANLNMVRAPTHPPLSGPVYPEANIHGSVRQPRPTLDGHRMLHKPSRVVPGYGVPVSEAVPRIRMTAPPIGTTGQEAVSQRHPAFVPTKAPAAELGSTGVDVSASGESATTTPKVDGKSAGNAAADAAIIKKKKIKRPAATVKLKKKKRKKGEDTDDFGGNLPPVSAASNAEKRRSSRNVKRKQYVEAYEGQLSDDMSESGFETLDSAEPPVVMKVDDNSEDLLIVEKILDARMRKVPIKEEEAAQENSDSNVPDKPLSEEASEETPQITPISNDSQMEEADAPPSSEDCPTQTEKSTNEKTDDAETSETSKNEEKYEDVEEYFLKYKNYSYLHCEWKTRDEIQDKRIDGKIKRFKSKLAALPEYMAQMDSEPFNPDFVEVERVLDVTSHEEPDGQASKQYFVKWCSLAYEDSTWENESDVPPEKIQEFEHRCRYRPPPDSNAVPNKAAWRRLNPEDGFFKGGSQLRDYQLEGLNWLLFNWHNRRNCILADEMGLGKTIQSITFLQKVFNYGGGGPFLVVAPLSTICNWQREFLTWTSLNAVVYHGSQASRDMIKTYEFLCRDDELVEIEGAYKMHVVITTYEMIVLENSHLQGIEWKCLIIDEAHRLKNQACKLADSLRCMDLRYKVLLTGTPLQNNVEELFALLNFLQPEVFDSSEAFMLEFGDLKDNSQVERLQEILKPMMLRRLKEDVEKSLAPKEETIIEVELTSVQKKYYRAILERNFEYLSKGSSASNVPNLMNTMMELRKCCNHPYLIKGAEEKIQNEYASEGQLKGLTSLGLMIQSSGKLVLIDKLLPRLKSGGHKVLVFSQMVRCLDILEDYLIQKTYSYERIDGGVRGSDRQMAIDRFSKSESDKFVFLLCTRAGGLGINLTAADTVIIFDSDWNPQNDLQAQARCHRIGQTKSVKIYRLITRNSYEREMFDKASLKLGLDKAVLQSMSGRQDEVNQAVAPALSKQEVENLLKKGAYGAIMDEDDDSQKFCEEDIDQILQRRTHTITIAQGEKGSTFSKASFVTEDEHSDITLNDPDFWEKWAKKADLDLNHLKNNKLIIEQPRHRKQTRRFGGMTQDVEVLAEIGSDSDSDYNEKQNSRKQKSKSRTKNWMKKDYFKVEKSLLTFGWGRWRCILANGRFPQYIKEPELEKVSRAILIHCLKFYNGDDKIKTFMWDLITPSSHSVSAPISNHEGLSTPIARGRRGRQGKDTPRTEEGSVGREWAKDANIAAVLSEESFKKHLQHHCNKILLRIRMLCYLQTEILHAAVGEELDYESIDLTFPVAMPESGLVGWDSECDRHLLLGVYKHGFGKYNLVRADPKLCFLKKFGMPDDKSLADDLDYEADEDNDDPEYKPAKINFNEFSEFEDSPASNTPGTAPPSPASSTDSFGPSKGSSEDPKDQPKVAENSGQSSPTQKAKEEEKIEAETEGGDVADKSPEQPKDKLPSWPTTSELNMRVRRMVTAYQKQHKQIRYRMMNMDRSSPSPKGKESSREKVHWTRREEADFYRTVSTFGVEYDEQKNLSWTKFRNIAKLDKKSDTSLELYYLSFKSMCEQVCSAKGMQGSTSTITKVTEERASRTLYRIELLTRVRLDVLRHKDLDARLKLCEPSSDLPAWWKPGEHDKELLIGMNKHGVTRTEIHILTDPSLSFFKSIHDHEMKFPSNEARKRKLESSPDTVNSTDKKKKVDSSNESAVSKSDKAEESTQESTLPKTDDHTENSVKEAKYDPQIYIPLSSHKWPKDRTLMQRVEHVCYCVIHGKWPVTRTEDTTNGSDLINARKYLSSHSAHLIKSDMKVNERKLHLEDKEKHSRVKMSPLSLAIEFEMSKNRHRRGNALFPPKHQSLADLMVHTQRKGKVPDRAEEKQDHNADLVNMCLYNSKITETLQSLLKTDLSSAGISDLKMSEAEKSIIDKAIKSLNVNPKYSSKQKNVARGEDEKRSLPKEEASSGSAQKESASSLFEVSAKKKPDKILRKKVMQKPKTGFISPAVLPSDARIPVYNPAEKKKLAGNEAPLNKDLADWLKEHPGYVVDYKNLRQKLNESTKESGEETAPTSSHSSSAKLPKVSSSAGKSRHERVHAEDSALNSTIENDKRSREQVATAESLLQQQSALNASLMNSFFGTTPEMAALLSRGILPGMLPPLPDQTKNYRSHKTSNSSHSKQQHQKSSQEETEAAALAAAVFGYPFPPDLMSMDPRKLKTAYPHFDEKLLAANANALSLSTMLGGMPGAMNPLLYSLYSNPELLSQYPFHHPMLMTSFNEKDFVKHKKEESTSSLSELFGVQHHQMPNPALDLSDPNLQKFMQAQMLDPYMMSALGTMSSKGANDFDAMFQSIYQQLSSMSPQTHSVSTKKGESADKHDVKRSSKSQSKEEQPMDLSSDLAKK